MTAVMPDVLSPSDPGDGVPAAPGDTRPYVISTHKVRDRTGTPPFRWVPYGLEHGWLPGTHRTLCGQWTAGWTVFWERRFSAGPSTACPACIEASLPAASRRKLDPVRAA